MAETTITELTKTRSSDNWEEEAYEEEKLSLKGNYMELLESLPREKGWRAPNYLYLFQHFWCNPSRIQGTISFQKHFQAKDNDIVIATLPKSGTTWLKALAFATVRRKHFIPSQNNHPLLNANPHTLVPFFEINLYGDNHNPNIIPDLSNFPEPRLFGTHIPFASLPDSIKNSNCKIIYICRNPFDNFVSFWHFLKEIIAPSLPALTFEEAFEKYSKGTTPYGPFWSHMLGYWKESKDTPNKVLFLKFEDLKGDTKFYVKRLAEFLGCPFSLEEESSDVIENIIQLCSFEKMKELEVNKSGKVIEKYENKHFFRKGETGDWVNYFSPWMTEKLSKVIEEKLGGSGLSF